MKGFDYIFTVAGTTWCIEDDLFFCLDTKEKKIKPENTKLKNYLKLHFRSRAVRPSFSTSGALSLQFFVVF